MKAVELMNSVIQKFLAQSERLNAAVSKGDTTADELDRHIAGSSGRQSADEVDYSGDLTVRERIQQLARSSGVTSHTELYDLDGADSHPSSAISGLGEILRFSGSNEESATFDLTCNDTSDYLVNSKYIRPSKSNSAIFAEVFCVCYPNFTDDSALSEMTRGFHKKIVVFWAAAGAKSVYQAETTYGILGATESDEDVTFITPQGNDNTMQIITSTSADTSTAPQLKILTSPGNGAKLYATTPLALSEGKIIKFSATVHIRAEVSFNEDNQEV